MPNQRLKELAALAQIYGSINEPQQREAASRQNAALAILGLMQQQQGQQQALEERRREADMRSGEFWGGTYPLQQQMQQDAAQQNADVLDLRRQDNEAAAAARAAELAYRGTTVGNEQMKMQKEEEARQRAAALQALDIVSKIPGTDLQTALKLGGVYDPNLTKEAQMMEQTRRAELVAQVVPELAALKDPKAREQHGRARLPWKGGYEEALSLAYPSVPVAKELPDVPLSNARQNPLWEPTRPNYEVTVPSAANLVPTGEGVMDTILGPWIRAYKKRNQ